MAQIPRGMLVSLAAVALLGGSASGEGAGQAKKHPARQTSAQQAPACGDTLGFQVFLDRSGFSPGEIDGNAGPNLGRALKAFQTSRNLEATGEMDCATWSAFEGEAAEPIVSYTLSDADVKGPFTTHIPVGLPEQATLPALGYRSPLERIAEKFHTSPAALQRLNGRTSFEVGAEIKVPNVQPFDVDAPKPATDPAAAGATVTVSRDESALRVTRADGTLLFFAPVTTGSEHDPLPMGDWMVTVVNWKPTFHYNPDLFWDAKSTDTKAAIKPGPNNPVGIVWIDLDLEHYGIHGSPEPSRIAKTESHGCVRLTNWDAAKLASLVTKGTRVQFR
jgi:lipoprotein-anchoring transpeptidase ErfK/SrfK